VLELEDRGADTDWTINTPLCSGTVSYKKRRASDTVTIVGTPVTLTVTVVDLVTGNPIEGVNVLVEAAAGGPLSVGTDIIKAFTDVNGEVADTREYASNQPITGRARLASSPGPYYRTGAIAGEIDSAGGLSVTVQMILDT
jgi:5-hydroxyisourate hydrolase-like protein (transthyretin family)